MPIRVDSLFRYPVKGLSAEAIDAVSLAPGEHFPGDRLFAVENGPSGFDENRPEHQEKSKFLVLARNAALAKLRTRYDDLTGALSIAEGDVEVARGSLREPAGRAAIEDFFRLFIGADLRGAPGVRTAPKGFRFMDSRSGFVSLINLATVRALEKEAGFAIEPIRFRANLYVDGAPAFAEFGWVDRRIRAGGAVLRGLKRTERCAAVTVNPRTATRDLMIPALLMRLYGHADCGIYCSVVQGGSVAGGDAIMVSDEDDRAGLPFA